MDNYVISAIESKENASNDVGKAAELFRRLSPDAQDAIIDLIKSLLLKQ